MDIVPHTGIHESMTSEDYHAYPAWSRSQLVDLKNSERLFYHKHILKNMNTEPSPQMIMGECVHLKILEPHLFEKRVAVHPKFNRATKVGKAEYEEFLLSHAAFPLWISEENNAIAEEMANNLRKRMHQDTGDLLDTANMEWSFMWEEDGLPFKCRPDGFIDGLGFDIKTSKDASYRSFQMDCVKRGYFLQAAMIRRGLRANGTNLERFVFCCVENVEPFSTSIYIVDQEAMAYGDLVFESLKVKLAEVLKSDEFHDNPLKIMTVPQWALQEDV